MRLTEEEKNLIAIFRGSEYHQDKVVVDLVDRLLAEKEEYDKKFESVVEWVPDKHCPLCIHDENWNPVSLCNYHYEIHRLVAENEELQSRLDTIKKALEEIELQTSYVGGNEMAIVVIKMHNIAHQAISSSPAPEPVTVEVEELAQEIAFSYEGFSILKDSFYLNTAKYLLTKFKMKRKP